MANTKVNEVRGVPLPANGTTRAMAVALARVQQSGMQVGNVRVVEAGRKTRTVVQLGDLVVTIQ